MKKTGVVEVDLLQFLEAQILRPGPVVERLGDDVPRSAVTLEFEDVDASLGIEGEEVDESGQAREVTGVRHPAGAAGANRRNSGDS